MSPFFNETNKFYGNYKSFSFNVGTKHHSKVLGSNLVLDGLVRKKKINLQCEIAFELKIQNQQTIYQEACDTVRCCNSLCENRQSIFFCSRPWQSLQRVYPTYFAVVMIESLKCAKYYCGKMALRKKKKMVHFREPKKSCQFFNVNCRWHQTKCAVFCLE